MANHSPVHPKAVAGEIEKFDTASSYCFSKAANRLFHCHLIGISV